MKDGHLARRFELANWASPIRRGGLGPIATKLQRFRIGAVCRWQASQGVATKKAAILNQSRLDAGEDRLGEAGLIFQKNAQSL